jgi:3,4-dihydroxy 2-butanone 4-phosphate synthase/GTP cyclohydrolase II
MTNSDRAFAIRRPGEQRIATATLPTEWGDFRATSLETSTGSTDHLALVMGDVANADDVLVRIHSGCLTGDLFGSHRCDCGSQLRGSLRMIAAERRGVLLYLMEHEGRGIGLFRKLQAYGLQERGADTVDANLQLGVPIDARSYSQAAAVLSALRVRAVRLLTNNPSKAAGLAAEGVTVVDCVGLPSEPTPQNVKYLETKRDRLGHNLPWLGARQMANGALGSGL